MPQSCCSPRSPPPTWKNPQSQAVRSWQPSRPGQERAPGWPQTSCLATPLRLRWRSMKRDFLPRLPPRLHCWLPPLHPQRHLRLRLRGTMHPPTALLPSAQRTACVRRSSRPRFNSTTCAASNARRVSTAPHALPALRKGPQPQTGTSGRARRCTCPSNPAENPDECGRAR